eukprot:2953728-Pyramimonas_sp.AAC.1
MCRVLGKVAAWFGGCRCHAHYLSKGYAEYMRKSEGCPWKGRRALELASGRLDHIRTQILEADSTQLARFMISCGDIDRATLAKDGQDLKLGLSNLLMSK